MFKNFKNLFQNDSSKIGLNQLNESNKVSTDSINAAEEFYNTGSKLFDNNDLDGALEYFNKAIKLNPNVSYYYNDRGLIYYYKEQDEQAKEDFDKAIGLDNKNVFAYYNRGRLYREGYKEYEKSIEDLNKAISLKPENARYYYELAETYLCTQDYDNIIKNYEKVQELDPDFEDMDDVVIKKCYTKMFMANTDIEIFSFAIADDVKDELTDFIKNHEDVPPIVYAIRGDANHLLMNNEEGIKDFLKYFELTDNETSEKQTWLLAHCYFREKQYENAIEYLNKAIEIDPDDSRYYVFRGMSYQEIGNNELALPDLKKTLEMKEDDGLAYLYLGFIYEDKEQYNIAADNYTKAIGYGLGNMNFIAHYSLGRIYYRQMNDCTNAIKYLSNSIKEKEEFDAAYWERGCVYCDGLNDYDMAVKDFDKALELNPKGKFYNSFAGYAYVHKGQVDASKDIKLALKDFDKAIEYYKISYESKLDGNVDYEATVGYAMSLRNSILARVKDDNDTESTVNEDSKNSLNINIDFKLTSGQELYLAQQLSKEFMKYINSTDEPENVKKMLRQYAEEPSGELLFDIELEYSPTVIKDVAIAVDNIKKKIEHSNFKQELINIILPAIHKYNEKGDVTFALTITPKGKHSIKILEESENKNLNAVIEEYFNSIKICLPQPSTYEDKTLFITYNSEEMEASNG